MAEQCQALGTMHGSMAKPCTSSGRYAPIVNGCRVKLCWVHYNAYLAEPSRLWLPAGLEPKRKRKPSKRKRIGEEKP